MYKTYGISPGAPVSPLGDLVSSLANGIAGLTSTHGGSTISEITSSGVLTNSATSFLNNQSYTNTKPKAFLNWILFDDQFKYVSSSSGASQVGADQELKSHVFNDLPISKNGYLYVYVSNETPNIDVFFDNLQVTHLRGVMVEETHYYPFGLTMSGISSKTLSGILENKFKYNCGTELSNKQFNDGSGIELYETVFRNYDPQLGRFCQPDPLADLFSNYSAYLFGNNNPVVFNDPLGLSAQDNSKGYTGWVLNTQTNEIYFDPKVHSQDDIIGSTNLKYLGERMTITSSNGDVTWYDENGNKSKENPH